MLLLRELQLIDLLSKIYLFLKIGTRMLKNNNNTSEPPIIYSPNRYPKNVNPINVLAKRNVRNKKTFTKSENMYFCLLINLIFQSKA